MEKMWKQSKEMIDATAQSHFGCSQLIVLWFQFHHFEALTGLGCHGLIATWAFGLTKQLLLLILLLATVCLHSNLDVHEKESPYYSAPTLW